MAKKYNSDWIGLEFVYRQQPTLPGEPPRYNREGRRVIVCLCGSTRFGDAFKDAMRNETLAGKIVLSVGLLGHAEGIDMEGPIKAELDSLHLDKIDLADEVLILNVGGYVGESTRREVLHAERRGKTIRWLDPFRVPADLAHLGDSLSDGPKVHRDSDDDPDKAGY